MPQTIQAVYEHGVFIPRTPVDLPEHTIVKLVLPKHAKQKIKNLKGCLAGLGVDVNIEDIEQTRKEIWKLFPRDID